MSAPLLTARQLECLSFIESFIDARGYAPTIREIGDHMRIGSTNGVNDHLEALRRKGYLARVAGRCRAIKILVSVKGTSNE